MFDRFTEPALRVLDLAEEEARLLDHGFVGTEHLLLGLIREGEGVAAKALQSLAVCYEAARAEVDKMLGAVGATLGSGPGPHATGEEGA